MGLRSLALLALLATCAAITCLDESGEPVSWWFIYKLPDGLRYAYRDVRTATAGTPFEPASGTLDCGTSCALGATLSQVYEDKENLAYVLYNDEEEADDVGPLNATETGHTKGVIAMNSTRGFWLVHSVPKFPLLTLPSYEWQASTTYGQSFLCITMRPGDINGISTQMQITYPIIYGTNLPDSVPESLVPEFYNLARGTRLSGSRALPWISADGITFTSFTKSPQWGADLYENLVIPGLKVGAGFMWETWRRSPYLPTYCAGVDGEVYTSSNVNNIALGSDPANAFKYTNDHSKWGVSLDSTQPYVCVGDINRMPSQRVRGGGTVCFEHNGLWRSLTAAVANADQCS